MSEEYQSKKPIAYDLYAGLGGWSDGLLAEGYDVVGYDIEAHDYGTGGYPGKLVLQDVTTLHGSQFKDATLIVASPPCQEYSYMAMPWSLAKAKAAAIRADESGAALEKLNTLFNACFRIQREACEAAGRHIPMVVENVRGAQPWVGRAAWNFGSFYLWGDVPALMPIVLGRQVMKEGVTPMSDGTTNFHGHPKKEGYKTAGMNWSDRSLRGQDFTRIAGKQNQDHVKVPSERGRRTDPGKGARFTSRDCGIEGIKQPGLSGPRDNGKGDAWFQDGAARSGSRSPARKAAAAKIAKIPFPLAQHIARAYKPSVYA